MKVDIIVLYVHRYKRGHEMNFVPPITGIHLAALTPEPHQVRIIHTSRHEDQLLQLVACALGLPRNKKVNTNPARNPPTCAM